MCSNCYGVVGIYLSTYYQDKEVNTVLRVKGAHMKEAHRRD